MVAFNSGPEYSITREYGAEVHYTGNRLYLELRMQTGAVERIIMPYIHADDLLTSLHLSSLGSWQRNNKHGLPCYESKNILQSLSVDLYPCRGICVGRHYVANHS